MRRPALGAVLLASLALTAAGGTTASEMRATTFDSVRLSDLPPLRFPALATTEWCGAGQPAAVDRKPEVDASSPRQVHVTYAIPADAPDQLSSRSGPIVTDIEAIDAWWRGQDPTRTPRFDLFAFPGCGTKLGRLDLGFVRLPRAGSLYVGEAGADRLLADLGQLDALASQKHLVFYDGPNVFDQFVCGTAFVPRNAPTAGGLSGVAFVWLRSLCGGDLGSGGLAASVTAHEMIHGLGSLIDGSPNECDPPNDGHVCDSTSDILYPEATSQTRLPTQTLDVSRNDYYGHSGSWFDVQDSAWLSRLPQFPLTIAVGGQAGVVRITSPTQLECAQACAFELDNGARIVLQAVPRAGSRFRGWSGACTGTGPCTVLMDAARSVSASFTNARTRLVVQLTGKGRVLSAPAGISCPGRCTATFASGITVRLRPSPAKGYRFAGWSGSCRGSGACLVPLDRNRTTRAIFRPR